MAITTNHITGFMVGLGISAVGLYAYRRNQPQVDGWLRAQGIQVSSSGEQDYDEMSLEDLVTEKERLEDIIAEREIGAQEAPAGDTGGDGTENPEPEAG